MLIAFILGSLLITGCSSSHPASDNYIRIAASTNNELNLRLKLRTWGSGVLMKERKISVYEASYLIDEPLTINQARMIALQTAEIIIRKLNNDAKIQEYLHETPSDIKNLLFSIYYFNPDENSKMSVTMAKETLSYDRVDSTTFQHTFIFKESYEEAVQKAVLSN